MTTVYCYNNDHFFNPSNTNYAINSNAGVISNVVNSPTTPGDPGTCYSNIKSIGYQYLYNNTSGANQSAVIMIGNNRTSSKLKVNTTYIYSTNLTTSAFNANPFPTTNIFNVTYVPGINTIQIFFINQSPVLYSKGNPYFFCQSNLLNSTTVLFYTPKLNTNIHYNNWSVIKSNFNILINGTEYDLMDLVTLQYNNVVISNTNFNTVLDDNITDLSNCYLYDTSYTKINNLNYIIGSSDISNYFMPIYYYYYGSVNNIIIPNGCTSIGIISLGGAGGGGGGGGSVGNFFAQGGGGGASAFAVYYNRLNVVSGSLINVFVGGGGAGGAGGVNGASAAQITDGDSGGGGTNSYIKYNSTNYCISYGGGAGGGGIRGNNTVYVNGGTAGSTGGTNGTDGRRLAGSGPGGVGGTTVAYSSTNFPYSNLRTILPSSVGGNGGNGAKNAASTSGSGGTSGVVILFFYYN
jgi:hypothetical protein